MILTECAFFTASLFAGVLAGVTATFFYRLGGASRAARAVFDFLTPLSMGALFFIAMTIAADGVFRFYALAAFFTGVLLQQAIHKKLSPRLRALARRLLAPLVSLENALERRVERALAPLRERRRIRREKGRALREEKRAIKEEKRVKNALAKEKKRREIEEKAQKRGERRRGEKEKRARHRRGAGGRPVSQSD